MAKLVCIAIGGALGSILRYALNEWVQGLTHTRFPVGILLVNVLGCAVIGFIAGMGETFAALRPEYQFGITIGVLGGFTTFSSFTIATHRLSLDGETGLAIANVLLSNLLAMAFVWIGYGVGRFWFGA